MGNKMLLHSRLARKLYRYGKNLPILDYHSHLSAKELYLNKNFLHLDDAILKEDDYKHRLMRECGIEEKFITGNASSWEKFKKMMEVLQFAVGNPVYQWFNLEMREFYGVRNPFQWKIEDLYIHCQKKLKEESFRPRELLKKLNVRLIYTTDSPVDDLEHHILLKKAEKDFQVLPSFRMDSFLNVDQVTFEEGILQLEEISKFKITSLKDLFDQLENRLLFFKSVGSKISDQGFDEFLYVNFEMKDAELIFQKKMNEQELSSDEFLVLKSAILLEMAKIYHKHHFIMQLHIGAKRDNSNHYLQKLGKNCGCDSINDSSFIPALSRFLNQLDQTDQLPKTVIYALDENKNMAIASLIGAFQRDVKGGKVHLGAAWWFNDHEKGIKRNLDVLMTQSVFSNFLGMLTDSSQVFSYVRIDYFRRILCDKLAEEVKNKLFKRDIKLLQEIIRKIEFKNIQGFLETGEIKK